ncbi:HlyC/CorC family transporter [Sinirhodobacter populi]|uniref:HlyC/CorC family transporter n=1 Tax=Paenirhodobacter populi TaxID=2306993 RepID=A0A443KPR7_9RHOB|nr:hemolysin family protein [Sinirhodobacter populi]RWR34955.1 HlyC/CorC family transporter [Sinirhodobacter populi]
MFLEILIVVALTALNGALSMSELAVVSSREAKLKRMAEDGSKGAVAALLLKENPGKFLSSVQIGITLVGIVAGAVSGAALGLRLSNALMGMGMSASLANTLGVGGVVAAITYAQLILGELVPKQVALADPDGVAVRVAPAMRMLARIATPIVWFLDISGRLVLRLIGQSGKGDAGITDEEVELTLDEAEGAGVFAPGEREMLTGVMRVADRRASSLMTPRHEVELLDLSLPRPKLMEQIRKSSFDRLPVRDGGEDDIIGVIVTREALALPQNGSIPSIVRPVPVVMDQAKATVVIEKLRTEGSRILFVFDEFGHFEGIITAMDVLEGIMGRFVDPDDDEPAIQERADGSLLVSGWVPADELTERLRIKDAHGDYDTAAGFVIDRLARLPQQGDVLKSDGWLFEVVDMDGARIDKILVQRDPAGG